MNMLSKVRERSPLTFNLWIAIFTWVTWYYFGGVQALETLVSNWPVALTMVFGSFIAGATSEGGGAIAFPVFTKVLHVSPTDAKVFSLDK